MKQFTKQDGFTHQQLIIIPPQVQQSLFTHPLISPLYLTDMGYFPKANYHHRERRTGCHNYILILCVDGCGTVTFNSCTISLKQHHFIIIPADIEHTYFASDTDPWSIYWLHFNGINAPHLHSYLMESHIMRHLSLEQVSHFITQFNTIYSLLQSGYSLEHIIQTSSFLNTLLISLKSLLHVRAINNSTTSNIISECILYMKENIDSTLNLDAVCNYLNVSKSYLISFFKEHTGFTPINYFIHLKMQKACLLLDTTTLTIKEIAHILGYNDPYYFSRIFKNNISYSPKHYRKIKKG